MSVVYVLSVNADTWKHDRWTMVAAFEEEEEAVGHGVRFQKENGNYAGYKVREVDVNPGYEEWALGEEEE